MADPKQPEYFGVTLQRRIVALREEFESDIDSAEFDPEQLKVRWFGRKQGRLKQFSDELLAAVSGDVERQKEEKRQFGNLFNRIKQEFEQRIESRRDTVQYLEEKIKAGFLQDDSIDITLPGLTRRIGVEHPLTHTTDEIVRVFEHLGYSVGLGPEVETDFYNFEALNFPPNQPARDTQDTLVIADQEEKPLRDRLLMRTHTSPVQIRTMLEQAPPLRIVIPGKVYRNEAEDATHLARFQQVEGLCVGNDITFSDLKGTLDHAMKALFGSSVKTRFFPSFFPFTEPSADMQISCIFCGGSGCRKCKHSGWIELLGCGMVDPAVFEQVNQRRIELGREPAYDPARISGFAFGMGVERIAMMRYGVSSVGNFYSADMRFLAQFGNQEQLT